MKKLIILLVIILTGFSSIQAQSNMRFGFEFSPFLAWLGSDIKTVESDGTQIGFQIAANGEYRFSDNYAIRLGLGLSFSQGGTLIHNEFLTPGNIFPDSKLSDPSLFALEQGVRVNYRINYIELPIALKMATPEYGSVKYFAEIPVFTFGFRTGAKGDIGDYEDENIAGDINLLNITWGLGAGIEYSLNATTSLIAGVYYHNGFTDVTSDSDADPNKASTRRLVLRIGVLF